MTPAARIAAAAEILDTYLAGAPAERALTQWARRSRFAGSGDRAAVRDHVFDAIRKRRSAAALGGGETGRGLMIGSVRLRGEDPALYFTGAGHALPPLGPEELTCPDHAEGVDALDCPEWLAPELRSDLKDDFSRVMNGLRGRAEVFVRVNTAATSREDAQALLRGDGVESEPHALSPTALRVISGARRINGSAAYREGAVELQDAASQAVAEHIPLPAGGAILDYCAGGGGKALALAARHGGEILVHDAKPERMKDIPARAARAGAALRQVTPAEIERSAPFALIVADVPCSGSGAWRRQPEAKWRLDRAGLDDLCTVQAGILQRVGGLTAPGGAVAYVTCSVLRCENEDQVARFLEDRPDWVSEMSRRWSPLEGGDGFYLNVLRRTG